MRRTSAYASLTGGARNDLSPSIGGAVHRPRILERAWASRVRPRTWRTETIICATWRSAARRACSAACRAADSSAVRRSAARRAAGADLAAILRQSPGDGPAAAQRRQSAAAAGRFDGGERRPGASTPDRATRVGLEPLAQPPIGTRPLGWPMAQWTNGSRSDPRPKADGRNGTRSNEVPLAQGSHVCRSNEMPLAQRSRGCRGSPRPMASRGRGRVVRPDTDHPGDDVHGDDDQKSGVARSSARSRPRSGRQRRRPASFPQSALGLALEPGPSDERDDRRATGCGPDPGRSGCA
jgi:hypothetical protein